ncbi:MAG: hypothetical protein HQL15_03340 [Candidatus Omnitrophica bacterium]|nr:hypothetical protein [Candidatus Omnitrophota bacterium]
MMSATVAMLWLTFFIDVSVVKAGARRVSFNPAKSVSIKVEPPVGRNIKREEFSPSMG